MQCFTYHGLAMPAIVWKSRSQSLADTKWSVSSEALHMHAPAVHSSVITMSMDKHRVCDWPHRLVHLNQFLTLMTMILATMPPDSTQRVEGL